MVRGRVTFDNSTTPATSGGSEASTTLLGLTTPTKDLSIIRNTLIRSGLALAALAFAGPILAQGPKVALHEPEFGIAVEPNVMIPMRDGVRLAADIYRPAQDGKAVPGRFPTFLNRTPYNKGSASSAEGKYYASMATWS